MILLKQYLYKILKKSEKYTQTDMVYVARSGFWITISQITSIIASFLLALAFANLLPPNTYGIYKYILALITLLAIPTLSGMRTAVIQSVARGFEGTLIQATKFRIKWGLIGAIASLGIAVYYTLNDNSQFAATFAIAALFLPFQEPLSTYGSFLSGKKKFKQASIFNILTHVIATIALLVTLALTNNFLILITVYLGTNTLLRALWFVVTIKKYKPNKKNDVAANSYGKHLTTMDIFGSLASQLDAIIIFQLLGPMQVALYTFAIMPVKQLTSLFKFIPKIALPKLSENSFDITKKSIIKKSLIILYIITPIMIGYIIIAPWIFNIFFPQYNDSVIFSQIFALSMIAIPSGLLTAVLQAKKETTSLYKLNIYGPIIKIIFIVIGVLSYGIMGMIIGRVLYNYIILGFSIKLVNDISKQ